jgi:hypothetical protein
MHTRAMALHSPRPRRARDRVAAGFLLVVLAAGTLVLCIGIPVGCLWLASKLTDSIGAHFLVALPMTLGCMGLFAALLYRVDRLYLRVTSAYAAAAADEEADDDGEPRVARGPLEPMIVFSLVIAVIALVVWFFFFAENPPRQVI